jgi:hypothetical protein
MQCLNSLTVIYALLFFFFKHISGQNVASFQYPTGNETYNILDTVIVQWTSNYATPVLFTWYYDTVLNSSYLGMHIPYCWLMLNMRH